MTAIEVLVTAFKVKVTAFEVQVTAITVHKLAITVHKLTFIVLIDKSRKSHTLFYGMLFMPLNIA